MSTSLFPHVLQCLVHKYIFPVFELLRVDSVFQLWFGFCLSSWTWLLGWTHLMLTTSHKVLKTIKIVCPHSTVENLVPENDLWHLTDYDKTRNWLYEINKDITKDINVRHSCQSAHSTFLLLTAPLAPPLLISFTGSSFSKLHWYLSSALWLIRLQRDVRLSSIVILPAWLWSTLPVPDLPVKNELTDDLLAFRFWSQTIVPAFSLPTLPASDYSVACNSRDTDLLQSPMTRLFLSVKLIVA